MEKENGEQTQQEKEKKKEKTDRGKEKGKRGQYSLLVSYTAPHTVTKI